MTGNPRKKTQVSQKGAKKDTIEIVYQYLRGINEMQIILLTWCDLSPLQSEKAGHTLSQPGERRRRLCDPKSTSFASRSFE